MGSRNRSRRDVLKTGATVASIGVLGSLSGCSELQSDDDSTADSDDEEKGQSVAGDVPAAANVVMEMDFEALLEDQALRGAVNDALSESMNESEGVPPSVEGVLDSIQEETEIDPRQLKQSVLFADGEGEGETEYFGYIVYSGWSGDLVRSKIEEEASGELETEEYGGQTVYVFDSERQEGRLVVFDDGTVVLGGGGAAHDVVDVRNGDADPISGDIANAWEGARDGYVEYAFDVDPAEFDQTESEMDGEHFQSLQYGYGSLYPDGDVRGVELNLVLGSAEDAEAAAEEMQTALDEATAEAEDERAREFVEETTVTTDGPTLTVRNEVPVDEITPVVREFVRGFVSGFTGRGSGFETSTAQA